MNLTIATNHDDWEGLYIDNTLVQEGNSLRWDQVIEENFIGNGVHIEKLQTYVVKGDWLYEEGSLPTTLEEVFKKEKDFEN